MYVASPTQLKHGAAAVKSKDGFEFQKLELVAPLVDVRAISHVQAQRAKTLVGCGASLPSMWCKLNKLIVSLGFKQNYDKLLILFRCSCARHLRRAP